MIPGTPQYQAAHNDGVRASLEILAPAILGIDPLNLNVSNAEMNEALDGHSEGNVALDIACRVVYVYRIHLFPE